MTIHKKLIAYWKGFERVYLTMNSKEIFLMSLQTD